MMDSSILYSEINVFCILVLLLLCIKMKKSTFLQEQRRLFLRVTVSNAFLLLLDSIWIFSNNQNIPSTIVFNWVLNGVYYMLSGLVGYFWFEFSEAIQESVLVRDKRYHRLAMLPAILLIVLTFMTFFNGWLFYVDGSNQYHRGPAYALQLLFSYGYVIFTAGKAFYLSFYTEDYRRKYELKTLATFVLPTLATSTLQVLLPGFPLVCIGNTIGILYVYLTLQEQLVSLDALTKLNNRNQLFKYLSGKLSHIHENKDLYLLIMDVDYFKSINDHYGHVEGDQALKAVANSLRKACANHQYFIARFGGDEFIAICELEQGESIQPFCHSIHRNLEEVDKPYRLSLSIGYTKYTQDIRSQQEFIDRADQELYKIKKNRSGDE